LVNGIGPKNLAIAARENNCVLAHYSTDYVLTAKNSPYTIADTPAPINNYGKSKLLGENCVRDFAGGKYFLIRLSAVFGDNPKASFPLKLISLDKRKKELKVKKRNANVHHCLRLLHTAVGSI